MKAAAREALCPCGCPLDLTDYIERNRKMCGDCIEVADAPVSDSPIAPPAAWAFTSQVGDVYYFSATWHVPTTASNTAIRHGGGWWNRCYGTFVAVRQDRSEQPEVTYDVSQLDGDEADQDTLDTFAYDMHSARRTYEGAVRQRVEDEAIAAQFTRAETVTIPALQQDIADAREHAAQADAAREFVGDQLEGAL